MVKNEHAPCFREIIRTVADKMVEVAPSLNRCFWKVAGLVDAVDDDDSQVRSILDLRKDNEIVAENRLEEQFSQSEMNGENEEVHFIIDGINEIDISNISNNES